MQFTFDLDIQAIVAKATAPEKIQPMLEKALSDALKSCIDDATGYNSEFRKAVKVQLAEAMPHGLDITDVAKFQQVANAVIANAVHGVNSETITTALKKSIGEIVPDMPARIKLSDLIDRAREGFYKESHEGFYARVESNASSDGYYHLYLDEDESPSRKYSSLGPNYHAKYSLAVNRDGEVYSMKFEGMDLTPTKLQNAITRLDGLMLALYTGRTTIEVDIDEDEVESRARAREYN